MNECHHMIVGIVGTANTGKTTLIRDIISSDENLRGDDRRWTLCGKDYRSIIEERGLSINRNGNEECQQIIHDTLLQNIIDAASDTFHSRIIMDRTVLDSFAYTYWHYRYGTAKISPATLDKMWQQVVNFSKLYTKILYIPMSFCDDIPVVDDKFRDTDHKYRSQIDNIFNAEFLALSSLGTNMGIIYGSRESRVRRFYNTEKMFELDHTDGSKRFESRFEALKGVPNVF